VLPNLAGWSRQVVGDETLLVSDRARASYREGLTPIVRFAALAPGAVGARLITGEGEYGASAAVAGGALAIVVGDYHYARLDVTAPPDADPVAIARGLAAQVSFGLGTRRRRVWHRGPIGWLGLPRGLASEWIGPMAPRGGVRIQIYPASPARLEPHETLAAILDEQRLGGDPVELLETLPRPAGLLARTAVGAQRRDWLLERADGYQYTARLESRDAADHAAAQLAFAAVIASMERIPRTGARPTTAMNHWLE
jgi:hypothetical protein